MRIAFGYREIAGEVLAAVAMRAEVPTSLRLMRAKTLHSSDLTEIAMKNIIKHSERPSRSILWLVISQPAQSVPQHESIVLREAGVLKRCVHSGSLEAH